MATTTDYSAVLEFWFGHSPDDGVVIEQKSALWWKASEATDRQIGARFGALREAAVAGSIGHWKESPRSRLALIILVDQFSRNLFRNDPRAIEHDRLAYSWCRDGLAIGEHLELRPVERVFYYLPLEHSEAIEDQERSVRLFGALAEDVPPNWRSAFANFVNFAVRHRDIIARFGRFPHRNAILGRASTPEEIEFLKQPGSSF